MASGYMEMEDEVFGFDGTRFEQLFVAQVLIKEALDKIKLKYMTPEEKEIWEAQERERLEAEKTKEET